MQTGRDADSGASYVYMGRRLECENRGLNFLTPGLFPRIQVLFSNAFRLEADASVRLGKDFISIRVLGDALEIIVVFCKAKSDHVIDVLVRAPAHGPHSAHKTQALTFVEYHIIRALLVVCAQPSFNQGVKLVQSVLRPDSLLDPSSPLLRGPEQCIAVLELQHKLRLQLQQGRPLFHVWKESTHMPSSTSSPLVDLLGYRNYLQVLASCKDWLQDVDFALSETEAANAADAGGASSEQPQQQSNKNVVMKQQISQNVFMEQQSSQNVFMEQQSSQSMGQQSNQNVVMEQQSSQSVDMEQQSSQCVFMEQQSSQSMRQQSSQNVVMEQQISQSVVMKQQQSSESMGQLNSQNVVMKQQQSSESMGQQSSQNVVMKQQESSNSTNNSQNMAMLSLENPRAKDPADIINVDAEDGGSTISEEGMEVQSTKWMVGAIMEMQSDLNSIKATGIASHKEILRLHGKMDEMSEMLNVMDRELKSTRDHVVRKVEQSVDNILMSSADRSEAGKQLPRLVILTTEGVNKMRKLATTLFGEHLLPVRLELYCEYKRSPHPVKDQPGITFTSLSDTVAKALPYIKHTVWVLILVAQLGMNFIAPPYIPTWFPQLGRSKDYRLISDMLRATKDMSTTSSMSHHSHCPRTSECFKEWQRCLESILSDNGGLTEQNIGRKFRLKRAIGKHVDGSAYIVWLCDEHYSEVAAVTTPFFCQN